MRWYKLIFGFVVALLVTSQDVRAEPRGCEPSSDCCTKRFAPVGGWHPYGNRLLIRWPCHCFPHCGVPDDYCRKPLPKVCWPPYPPYYTWGAP